MQDGGSEPREALDLISEVEVEILLDPLTMRWSEDLVQKFLRRRRCKHIVFGLNHLAAHAKHRRPSDYDVQVRSVSLRHFSKQTVDSWHLSLHLDFRFWIQVSERSDNVLARPRSVIRNPKSLAIWLWEPDSPPAPV